MLVIHPSSSYGFKVNGFIMEEIDDMITFICSKYSVANLAALGCVRFLFVTFLTGTIGFLSKRTRTREIDSFFKKRTNTMEVDFFSKQLMQPMQGYFYELKGTFKKLGKVDLFVL